MFRNVCCGLVTLLCLASGQVIASDDWPQWRGPDRNGVSQSMPWSDIPSLDSLYPAWKVDMGPGYSGPIIANGTVFVTETVDEKYEVVRALNLESGSELWRAQWEGAMTVPFFARKNGSWIRSTPAFDDGHLYVAGMVDLLVCLDAETGREVWRFDFVKQLNSSEPTFGFVSSPLVDGDNVYVQAGGAVAKVHKKTGKLLWRTMEDGGGMMGSAFSSPMITTINGQRQLVVQGRTHLGGVSMDDGKVLWQQEIPSYRGMNILTPTFYDGGIFTSNYKGKSYLFDVEGQGLKSRWENKAMGYMSTPVIIDGNLYMHLQNRRISCLNLETGEERWRSSERFGDYWSMVVVGKMILALDSDGTLLLVRPNPEKLDILDRKDVADSSTWAHLAVSGNHLIIRALDQVMAWSIPEKTARKMAHPQQPTE